MAATLVSVEEYLGTSYPDGDREYVDGEIVERNAGEIDHGSLQSRILGYVHTTEAAREAKDGLLRTADPAIEMPLYELLGK
jgi:hypothetical protein